ncbi:hypothetical protein K457DRAFT_130702 [Linnemannia elongata AG-77]|uniref:PH domain-containing protein n=1 Tax=Linnemannia elongata AG-77 TaxID=1314771 RepID=A0A197JDM5_9FUNG|nr:hypothetical protein K457DRAFT_130702 [Linnemannia elongata AG-77]
MLRKKSSFSSHSSSHTHSPLPGSRSSSSASNHRHNHNHSISSSYSYNPHQDYHNHHYNQQQQTPTSGVRRALSSLQNALTPSRSSSTIERKKATSTFAQQQQQLQGHQSRHGDSNSGSNTSDSISLGITHADSSYSAHSNGTSDSFLSPATMTPLTTTDDDSSTIASTHLQQQQQQRIPRSRQVSKNGSLSSSFTSPLSAYPHSDLSNQLDTLTLQTDATLYSHHRQSSSLYRGEDGKDSRLETSSIVSGKSGTISASVSTVTSTIMASPSASNGGPFQLRVRHLEQGASYTGYLTKFSSRTFFSRKQWKRRYFVLNQQSLHCFKSSDPQHPLLETLELCAETIVCVTDIFSGKRYCLQITSPGQKNWYVLADSANELSGWLRQLKGTVFRCRNPQQAMDQDPLYQYQQLQLSESRPRTHYSDSSEWSDLSSAASYGLVDSNGMPSSVPPFASNNSTHASSYLSNLSRSSSPLPTPPRRPPHPSERHDLYVVTPGGGLNPHPRPMTPSFSPIATGGGESTLGQEQVVKRQDDHRHRSINKSNAVIDGNDNNANSNNAVSSGQLSSDYASFGEVMERAEAVSPEPVVQGQGSSGEVVEGTRLLSFPHESNHLPPQPSRQQQKKNQQKRDSSLAEFSSDLDLFTQAGGGALAARRGSSSSSTFSSSSGSNSRRVSVVIDRPEAMITLPRRSSQRLMGSPSRPMSPVSSRPMSPNANRPSPRSSLVVTPPPRSIHRPTSVSVRHSTQILSPLQIATQNLQQGIRAAAEQNRPMSPSDGFQRPGSRLSHFRYPSNVGLIHDRSPNGFGRVSLDRPTSPTSAALASPPTSPLPEPPRSGSVSPVRALRHSLSNSSPSSHRISIVPRHHDPDLLVSHRANPRSRAQSQESALVSRTHDKHFVQPSQQHPHRASSPLPAFASAIPLRDTTDGGQANDDHDGQDAVSRKHISLPVHSKLALPPPPKGQQPDAPTQHHHHHHQYQHNTFPRQHKHSLSNASVSSMSSQTSSTHSFPAGIAIFGGAVARKNGSRDSALSARLSTLVPIPVGSVSPVSLPPQTALPPIPGSVPSLPTYPLPTPPTSGKVEVVLIPSARGDDKDVASVDDDAATAVAAVPLTDLPTPPTSVEVALPSTTLPTHLADVQEEARVESFIDHQKDSDAKVDPLSGDVAPVTVADAVVEQSPSKAFEMILEETEEADVSGSELANDKEDTTTTTTTTSTITTTTKDLPEEQKEHEEDEQEDIVANLAIESASPISS